MYFTGSLKPWRAMLHGQAQSRFADSSPPHDMTNLIFEQLRVVGMMGKPGMGTVTLIIKFERIQRFVTLLA